MVNHQEGYPPFETNDTPSAGAMKRIRFLEERLRKLERVRAAAELVALECDNELSIRVLRGHLAALDEGEGGK